MSSHPRRTRRSSCIFRSLTAAAGLLISFLAAPSITSAQAVPGGKFGRGLLVTETTYAAVPYNPVYFVAPMTVECWVKIPPKPASDVVLLANQPRHSVEHWELYAESGTGNFCISMPGYAPKQVKSTAPIADGQWHFLATVYEGTSIALYVDAAKAASSALKKIAPYPDTGPLTFGCIEGEHPHAGVMIDEVRISRVKRPIDRLPAAQFTVDADTVGLWHFDEDTVAYEKSGFADASTTRNPARTELFTLDAYTGGGFNGTRGAHTRWADMDLGVFFSSSLGIPKDKPSTVAKAISIRLGKDKKHAIAFDTDLLRVAFGWSGDFVKIYDGREGLAQHPDLAGELKFATAAVPGWGKPGAASSDPHTQPATGEWVDPRPDKLGPLPADWARYKGLYVHGDRVILSYTVGANDVLEMPGVEEFGSDAAFTRTFFLAPAHQQTFLRICDVAGNTSGATDRWTWRLTSGKTATLAAVIPAAGGAGLPDDWAQGRLSSSGLDRGSLYFHIPPHEAPQRFKVVIWSGPSENAPAFEEFVRKNVEPVEDIKSLTTGGPARFPNPVITQGIVGKPEPRSDGAYVVDTLTAPDDNPWKSFIRFGGLDFFSNGDAALCSVSGDVWVLSGIDQTLQNLRWRRFATGLFQPLGLKIVDDTVYVLGRDQITRLQDLNHDGEADFYECFNNECKVTPNNGHSYATCLETDAEGNFYYCKCGDSTGHGGTVLRVDKYGHHLEVFATGVRNPNGLGGGPHGLITEADNQGEWVPASRVDIVQHGTFLGFTPMAHHDTPPTSPGTPIVYMPQDVDNSSGGQTWVLGNRWGLPDGEMLHTSYGAAALLHVMTEEVNGITQGGVYRFPFRFATGIMRGRFREADGQLYLCGLCGWQTAGVKDGALQRVRYTGRPIHQPAALHIRANGILLTFTCPLDPKTAADAESWSVLQWNYQWSAAYGSPHFSVRDPKKQGYDQLEVKSAKLLKDGRTVFLEIPDLRPAMNTKITYNLDAADGTTMQQDVHCTIHVMGKAFKGE